MSRDRGEEQVLIVDDAGDTRELLQRTLQSRGYRVLAAAGVAEAVETLATFPVDLVVTDIRMPKVTGLDLVRHVRENLRDTAVIAITGYATVPGAVEAMKLGADEYLSKPFTDDELLASVRSALDGLRRRRSVRASSPEPPAISGLLGESEPMNALRQVVEKAAGSSATVLITGESGTGKELVARAIHHRSPRVAAPFTPVNCAAILDSLLEAQLFGYVKGAFTGATETRAGFFVTTDGGTLFLDEVGSTSLAMQAGLLRVLQDKVVNLVGDPRPRRVDVRVVAATNRDLELLVRQGRFREDLFYRLNVIAIQVPPLRKRAGDVPSLLRHFAERFSAESGREPPSFTAPALDALCRYEWPGNVRELENLVHRLVVLAEGREIDAPDLPAALRFSAAEAAGGGTPFPRLAEHEATYVRKVLDAVGGNKTRAAEILGIDRKTLRSRLDSAV